MAQAPGYEKWPQHQIREVESGAHVSVRLLEQSLAESSEAIKVVEDKHPVRYYFPKPDVRMDLLEQTDSSTHCPFKGTASYYRVRFDGNVLEDAAWSYEQPYDEHQALKGRVAFDDAKFPQLKLMTSS